MKIVNTIYNEDCIKGMARMPKGKIDLIVTDPPFAINFKSKKANYNRKQSLVLDGYNEISEEDYSLFTVRWIEEAKNILKESGSIYIFSGYNNLEHILHALNLFNFHIVNHIVWQYQFGVYTSKKYVTSHYLVIYACLNPKLRNFYTKSRFKTPKEIYKDLEDVWFIKRPYWHGKEKTPTKLPEEVIEKILSYSSKKGDLVFDPFLGSGQVPVVAKKMKRKYCGFEIVSKYWNFAIRRLNKIGRQ